MNKVVVTAWAFKNIVTDSQKGVINGYNRCTWYDYGHAMDDTKEELYFFVGEQISETEKAICFSVPCFSFNSRCEVTRRYNWNLWIPKKCVKEGVFEFKKWAE